MEAPRSQQLMRAPVPEQRAAPGISLSAPRMDPSLGAATNRALDALGGALRSVGDVAFQMSQRRAAARRQQELTTFSTGAARDLQELQLGLERSNDWRAIPGQWKEGVADIRARYDEKITDPLVGRPFEARFNEFEISRGEQVRRRAFQIETQEALVRLAEQGREFAARAAAAPADERMSLIDAQIADIDGYVDVGYLSPADGDRTTVQFLGMVDEASARRRITEDPERALVEMASGAFPNIDPLTLAQLLDMTSRRADAVSADRARAAEKAEADARVAADDRADELYVEGLALAADGELTREWLDARQDLLTPRPAAYRTLLAALEGDDVKDVPATVAELQAGLYGDPEQTRVLARAALFAGEITTGTYRAIDNKAAELMESGPASAFDRARQYLRNILIPHPDLSSPADKIRYARAIDEFDRLILEGELQNASDAEILPLRDEIEQRWVFISLSNTALALPNMRFADRPQSTDPNVVKATLLAASIELQRRVEANEIPPEAAVREAIVLEQWWTYLDQLLARAAQQSGAR